MDLSQTGLDFIKQWEGFRNRPYDDGYGTITIGYGHAIRKGESFGEITREQAEDLLARDVQGAVNLVNSLIQIPLDQSQFDASVSLAFNWGGFPKSEYLQLLNSGEYDLAASRLGEFPVTSKGVYSQGLANRRQAERDLFYGYYDGLPAYEGEQGITPDISVYSYEPSGSENSSKSGELLTILAIGGIGLLVLVLIASGSSQR